MEGQKCRLADFGDLRAALEWIKGRTFLALGVVINHLKVIVADGILRHRQREHFAGRHGLGAALQLRVALVLLIAWSVDALWVGRNVQPTVGGRGTSSSTRSSATEGLVATTVDSDLNSPALPDVDVSRSNSVPSSTRS